MYKDFTGGKTEHKPIYQPDRNYQVSRVKTINQYGMDPL